MVDPWTGPPPVSNQFPHNEPDGIRKLLDKIKAVELQVKESTSHLGMTAPGLAAGGTTNFALTTTMATLFTLTMTVPPGFTQCAVSVSSRVYAINPNTTGGADAAGADYIYTRTNIAGTYPTALPILVGGSGNSAVSVAPFSQLLTGLTPGSTFDITVEAKTSYAAWAANTLNLVDLSGFLSWFQ